MKKSQLFVLNILEILKKFIVQLRLTIRSAKGGEMLSEKSRCHCLYLMSMPVH